MGVADGVTRYNELLANRRADSLKAYLVRHAQIPGELVSVRGEGIGWGVLRQLVAASAMPDKDEVLHILDNTPVWIRDSRGKIVDGRKKQLMDLCGGRPYNYMMEHIFPEVRSSLSATCYRKAGPSAGTVPADTASTDTAPAEKQAAEPSGLRDTAAMTPAGPEPGIPAETSPATPPEASGKLREVLARNLVIKTNLLYDAVLMPSLEAEYRFNDRWTINLEGEIAWWKKKNKNRYYQLATISPEVRRWFGQRNGNPGTGITWACSAASRGSTLRTRGTATRARPKWRGSATATCSPLSGGSPWRRGSAWATCTASTRNTNPCHTWAARTTSTCKPSVWTISVR